MWVYEKDYTECDGCTWSVLEYEEGSRDRAFHASGWFHDPHTGWDLCPACRPDSPFTAVKRVRALHGRHDPNCPYGEDCAAAGLCLACREEYPCATIRAIEGDSDD